MKKIAWVKISSRKYGGVAYEETAQEILRSDFEVEPVRINSRIFKRGYLRAPEVFFNLLRLKGEKNLWVRDSNTIITLPFDRTRGKNLAVIHHIDFSQSKFPFKIIDFFIEKMIYHGLKSADMIVTVSEYWRNHFVEKGYSNVQKIYNCFDMANFNISKEEAEYFKKEYKLEGKPIVYLGSPQRAKGVLESCEVLKGLDCYLVTSGEPLVEARALNLQLEYKDYLRLMKAASVVVQMSKFKEGWCRIAHEAMLLGTPVIGSGRGGMGELLERGGQIICKDFNQLRERIEYLLNNPQKREEMSETGFNFAKTFTLERFKEKWLEVIKEITN